VPKSNKGRPSKLTPEIVTKLVAAFSMGYNDSQACLYSGVSRNTFYSWMLENVEFRDRIRRARIEPNIKAREVVVNALNNGDLGAAKWWLEKKSGGEFSGKQDEPAIPAERQTIIDGIQEIVQITEHRIALRYQTVIFNLLEEERLANKGKGSQRETTLRGILQLPHDQLADHILLEVSSTGKYIADVKELLLERQEIISHRKDLLREARESIDGSLGSSV
jgi:hypothetical protein